MKEEKKEKKGIYSLLNPREEKEKHMTLLFWSEAKKNHYAWIKNVNTFLSSQTAHKTQM